MISHRTPARALLVCLALSACPSIGVTTMDGEKALITTCASYAGALTLLTPLRDHGKLSVETVVTVNNTVRVVGPICNNDLPLPGNPSTALAYIRPLVDGLGALANGGK